MVEEGGVEAEPPYAGGGLDVVVGAGMVDGEGFTGDEEGGLVRGEELGGELDDPEDGGVDVDGELVCVGLAPEDEEDG